MKCPKLGSVEQYVASIGSAHAILYLPIRVFLLYLYFLLFLLCPAVV